jgi:membrane-bound serine protease (ClpP class)
MAIHPKIGVFGAVLIGAVALGLILFLLGRMTSGANLGELLFGVGAGLAILTAVVIGMVRHLPASRHLAGLLHEGATPSEDGYVSAPARSDLLGKSGVAVSELRPAGVAEIEGERVDVTTEGDYVRAGSRVLVVRAEGMRLVVRAERVLPAS